MTDLFIVLLHAPWMLYFCLCFWVVCLSRITEKVYRLLFFVQEQ